MKKYRNGKVPNTIPARKFILINDEFGDTLQAKISRILHRNKIFLGTSYEKSYSFWAKVIPETMVREYDQLKDVDVEKLRGKDIRYLRFLSKFLDLASLQEKYDNESLEDEEEYLRYLKFRINWPLEELKWSKLTKKEHEEVENLLMQENILPILEQKDNLSLAEVYVKEEKEHQEFVDSMIRTSVETRARHKNIDNRDRDIQRRSFELAKHTRFI